jgi:hypothetical protein
LLEIPNSCLHYFNLIWFLQKIKFLSLKGWKNSIQIGSSCYRAAIAATKTYTNSQIQTFTKTN